MSYIHKTHCRICGSTDLVCFLQLGMQPPVDNFIDPSEKGSEKRYPLDVYFCKNCSLVQLLDVVSPDELFHDEYAYFSSASAPLVSHFEAYAASIQEKYMKPGELIIDIGSNDGVLLQFFTKDYRVLGVEPSGNVASVAKEKGIETLTQFFTPALATELRAKYGPAKVVTANNVFAHIDTIGEIVEGVQICMEKDGVYVFEAHYIVDFIQKVEFDTVYHEHLCYYSVKALQHLFSQYGMDVFDVERVAQHGGSIRVSVCNKGEHQIRPSVAALRTLEEHAGLYTTDVYFAFQEKVNTIAHTLRELVRKYRDEGKIVTGYGAPAKGNTLLNFCGFTEKDLQYITDTTPQKIGKLTPGSNIPVVHPSILLEQTPDYILLLAWNYKDFILEKEKALRQRGTKFIIPIPSVEIV